MKKKKKKNIFFKKEFHLAIIFTISIVSFVYPYGFPLFGSYTLIIGSLLIVLNKIEFKFNFGIGLILVLICMYLFGIIMSGGVLYNVIISDIINIICFIIIWLIMGTELNINRFIKLLSIISTNLLAIIGIISLYKFNMLLANIKLSQFMNGSFYPNGTSLVKDYNMFTYGFIIGMIFCLYLIKIHKNKLIVLYYNFVFFLLSFVIVFAGSRRGWISLFIVWCIFIIQSLTNTSKRNFKELLLSLMKPIIYVLLIFLMVNFITNIFSADFVVENQRQLTNLSNRLSTLTNDDSGALTPRVDRLNYSAELFEDYNFIQFFIGDGFNYISKFGIKFSTSNLEDYPHNPVISSLLYSGVIGIFFTLTFILYSFYFSIKNYKIIGVHFLLIFLISILYVFISFNSIFSNEFFFLSILVIIYCEYSSNKQNKNIMVYD